MVEDQKKKNSNNGDEQKRKEKKNNGNGIRTFILKADLHCEECVSKVLKCIRSFTGVQKASIGDAQQITVVGKVDAATLCHRLEKKTHRNIHIVSPTTQHQPHKPPGNNDQQLISDASDTHKLPVKTAVLKVQLHCHGCTQKISKLVRKTKGYEDMKIDRHKETVTVTGAMDMNALVSSLKKHLKRDVQILPQVEKKDTVGADKPKVAKGKPGGGGAKNGGGDGGSKPESIGREKVGGDKSESKVGQEVPIAHGSDPVVEQFQYNPCEFGSHHAPQIFSDENPNACRIM